jgi:hypothetical protein
MEGDADRDTTIAEEDGDEDDEDDEEERGALAIELSVGMDDEEDAPPSGSATPATANT